MSERDLHLCPPSLKRLLELHNHNAVRVARALGLGATGNTWVNKVARGELTMTAEKRNRVEHVLRESTKEER